MSTSASEALDGFARHLADRQFARSTQRIRRHFLEEYLQHAQQATGRRGSRPASSMDPARTDAWLSDAAAGKLRTRNTLRGPRAAEHPNSMRVRITPTTRSPGFSACPTGGARSRPPAGST